jgi:hypothetical protein
MKTTVTKLLLSFSFLLLGLGLMAQAPPHPPGSHGSGASSEPAGPAGTPVGSGVVLLIGLSAMYGAKKVYHVNQSNKSEE